MSKPFFYDLPILPVGFSFPMSFLELARSNQLPDIEPWSFLFTDMPSSLNYYGAMLQKYPDKPLIPFAIIDDKSGFYNDGYAVLACFDGDDKSGNPKVYFHDYAKPKAVDWRGRFSLSNFSEWLKVSGDESARYKVDSSEEDE